MQNGSGREDKSQCASEGKSSVIDVLPNIMKT